MSKDRFEAFERSREDLHTTETEDRKCEHCDGLFSVDIDSTVFFCCRSCYTTAKHEYNGEDRYE